jgi:phytoene dehydrogenase-like protein
MDKSVIIIGAGIAGLAAGCYAQMNGFKSQIFELHDLPGGLCTAWNRKNYILDGCIHYLFGTGKGQPFNQVWQELGALKDTPIINHSELIRVTEPGGKTLVTYSDPDRLEAHMHELSPADAKPIRDLADGVRTFTQFDLSLLQTKPRQLWGPQDWADFGRKMLPFMPAMAQFALVSAEEFARNFTDPFLRRAVAQMFSWPEIPMMAALASLAYMHNGNAGFPKGGSREFSKSIERRYLELGGEIHYKSQVEKIFVENHKAVGVRLYNDEVHRADYVISACDGKGTLHFMLDDAYTSRKFKSYYDGHLPVYDQVQVSLGVNRDLSKDPHWAIHLLDKPLFIAGQEHRIVGVKNYCFDPSLAPEGKSSIIIMLRADYDYWQRIYGHRLYDTEQDQVADILTDYLETLYPGLRQDIEMVDVATPLSYERYTGNYQGSSTGWLLNKQTQMLMIQGVDKTLPGLGSFYMAGEGGEPGGSVAICAMSGRNVIQMICAAEKKPFTTQI